MKFNNGKELLDLCSKENLMISDIMIKLEMNNYNKTEDEVFAQMHKSFIIMKNAVHKSLTEDIKKQLEEYDVRVSRKMISDLVSFSRSVVLNGVEDNTNAQRQIDNLTKEILTLTIK